ncbi:hypothetical protein F5Y17DRAFT_459357 [Xylariaceae sp. FL0594]|nr:hypothetical protein F5Y17DRAFT_459357 [Xylariaceae sp. FL0594]
MPFEHGFSLHVTVFFAPQNVPVFFDAFKPVYEKVIEEPENRFFEVYRSTDEPGTLSWVEDWNQTEYLNITEPLFLKPREAVVWDRVGGEYFYTGGKKYPTHLKY